MIPEPEFRFGAVRSSPDLPTLMSSLDTSATRRSRKVFDALSTAFFCRIGLGGFLIPHQFDHFVDRGIPR